MENIKTKLWMARIKGFLIEGLGLLALVFLGMLNSSEFTGIITAHFGTGIMSSMALLGITGFVKHMYNVKAIKKAKEKFGADVMQKDPIILI